MRYGYPSGRLGYFRLNALPKPENYVNFWQVPNLLLQKFTAEEFTATTKIKFFPSLIGDRTGLIVMGEDYSYLEVVNKEKGFQLNQTICENARLDGEEVRSEPIDIIDSSFYLRVKVSKGAICDFYCSTDSLNFTKIGESFTAKPGRWIGAKVGLFCLSEEITNNSGYVNVDWFRIEK